MKRFIYLSIILLAAMATACSDYLETPPSVELDEDKVFADRTLAEKYLTGIYAQGLPLGFNASTNNTDRRLGSSSTLGSACDEAEDVADWAKGNSAWNVDNHNNNRRRQPFLPTLERAARVQQNIETCARSALRCRRSRL